MNTLVFIVDLNAPSRRIRCGLADIEQAKWTWAKRDGRRYLVGSSAFYTHAAACRAKVALLLKVVRCEFLRYRRAQLYTLATQQLREYQARGAAAWEVKVV
jgi:hypothetical protein